MESMGDWRLDRLRGDLTALLADGFDDVVDTRRTLHARPELAFKEFQTTALVRERLVSLGLAALPCPTETGAVSMLEGGRTGKTVLMRADMDALPVQEEVALPFRSVYDGRMHACGHDAHTASLLGVAAALAQRAEELPGRYVFLFQPAEEALSGAKAMIDGGVLDGIGATSVLSWHVASPFPVNTVFVRHGVTLSEVQGFQVGLRGPGGHGAFGDGGVIRAIGELARSLATVVEGMDYEGTECACSAGMLRAGTALNVLPTAGNLQGTLRTFTSSQKEDALGRLQRLCRALATSADVEVELELTLQAPAVVNDHAVTEALVTAAARALSPEQVMTGPPLPPSDDASEFLNRIPGCFFFVGGQRGDGTSGMHHSPTFAIDEDSLRAGALVMAQGAVEIASR